MNKKVIIELQDIVKSYDDEVIVNHLNLQIYENEFLTLLGPSGCGKTTTLRMIGGFETPDEGRIILNDKIINDIPAYARPINTVFQKYALFPHLNVLENVVFGLKNSSYERKVSLYGKEKLEEEVLRNRKAGKKGKITRFEMNKVIKEKIYEDAKKALELVNLKGYEERNINQLSGGQQQRVGIARAIVNKPKILLLDEPLSALDLKLRQNMQYELKEMQRKLGITFIFVTHDQEEAMTMSDRIVVMQGGVIQQLGTPKEIYNEPKNRFIANFIGESNIFRGVYVKKDTIKFDDIEMNCVNYVYEDGEECDIVIRPEDFDIVDASKSNLKAEVRTCIFKGVHYEICAYYKEQEIVIHSYEEVKPGDIIGLKVDPYEVSLMRVNKDE
ncbi:MAG: ABC transporter ATP-binding protein [Bacilli bacterium]|nr:ABC transporter ATP-binding protein [Bacillales bacterium]MDD7382285.1 ABC transporter ATP-binding protein [Bacillales bacterium]MDY2746358.1 ABC transporter ATP-binding protein [Bacilli bacterium]MDY3889876.1 ABC transporter ATP-binding protein [Bacilli bacterium]MDY6142280.1 ABC transporter ATP-binding protein [Bacilli bacterium]